jgi:hypothetical protein
MATPVKPYEVVLDPELAEDILTIPLWGDEDLPPARTIGERVQRAVKAVEEANQHLANSPVARILADTLMRQQKKRGYPSIRVQPDGSVILHVAYEKPEEEEVAAHQEDLRTVKSNSDLPKLDLLREEAEVYGVDISDLGRARRRIYDRLEAHKRKLRMTAEKVAHTSGAHTSGAETPPKSRLVDEVTESKPKVIRRKKEGAAPDDDLDALLTAT